MKTKDQGHILGLDGLRAIAALIVVAYHLLPGIANVGYIGVDMFFVISGFLITSLLMKERELTGVISLGSFWLRRIRRLVPAVVVATAGSLALARIFGGDTLIQLGWQALGSVTGTYNWMQILHASSYFNQQSPLMLNNMWSLSVEQQFYLVWPLILIVILLARSGYVRVGSAVALAVASVAVHAVTVGNDPTSAYVSTFSHAFGLMIGASLALALPGIMTGARNRTSHAWGYGSWVALAAILVFSFTVPDSWLMYPWGMLLVSLLTAVVIRGILPDVPGLGARSLQIILEFRPIVWLGHLSYGIYLWHWPLHVIGFYHSPLDAFPTAVIVLVLSIICADLSYRYIETPIRKIGFLGWLREIFAHQRRRNAYAVGAAIVFILAGVGIATAQDISSGERYVRQAQQQVKKEQQAEEQQAEEQQAEEQHTEKSEAEQPEPQTSKEPDSEPVKPAPKKEPAPKPPAPDVVGSNVLIIGDSVTVAATPALNEALPGVIVDGQVSRSVRVFASIAHAYAQRNELRPYVVVALGTNGAITADDGAEIMRIVGADRRVVFVTATAPPYATWVPISNNTMRALAAQYPDRVAIADWEKIAKEHPENLAGDGIHPDVDGSKMFADAVVQALQSFANK